jgi:hypothetical protein
MYREIPVNAQKSSAVAKNPLQNDEDKAEKLTRSVTKEDAKHHGKARRYPPGSSRSD